MPKISVIIPVYNGERHIVACYQSLTYQTLTDWEAVFINDGSNDNTEDILYRLEACDSRIKVVCKRNEGVAVAREWGIKEASGEIITFLDIDDTFNPNALQQYIDAMEDYGVDIAIAGFNIVSENGITIKKITYKPEIVSGNEAVAMVCDGRLRWQLWGKSFRKTVLLNTITPIGIRSGEDMAVCIQSVENARKVKFIDRCLYNYIQIATSVTHAKAKEISMDALHAAEFVESISYGRIAQDDIHALFMLIISGSLRAGIEASDKSFRKALSKHFSVVILRRLDIHKAINILLFKYLHINLAKIL